MSCVSKTLINGCLTTLPPHFTTTHKTISYQNPFLSTSLKPIKLNLSCSYSSSSFSLPSFLSLRKTNPKYPTVVSVYAAQEQEEEGFVEEAAVEEGDEAEAEEVEEEYQEPNEDAKLYVGNLPYDVDSESLAQLFGQAGVVEISEVIYDRQTDRSRGFGFVTMSTVEEAEKAAELYNRYDLNGRLLTVNKAARKGSQPERPPRTFEPSFKIYVGNISWDVDDAGLEQIFSEHGKVVSARVISDRDTGRSRGFGFVTMASEAEMSDAIANLDGQTLDGRTIRVNAAEERPRRNTF